MAQKKIEVKRLPELEYIMPRGLFNVIADDRSDKKSDPYVYVMEYVNQTFGFLGTVTEIRLED